MKEKLKTYFNAYNRVDKEAQKLLDGVSISAFKKGAEVIFRTNVEGGHYGSGRNGRTSFRREAYINYVVYPPAYQYLTLNNQYCNVVMGNFSEPLYAKVQYCNFTALRLMSDNNYISVQYGKTDIQELNKATLKQQYGSGMTIGAVQILDLNAQYAAVKIGIVKGNALIKQQYGSGITIGTVENI